MGKNWTKNKHSVSEQCHPIVKQFFALLDESPLSLNWLTDNTPLTSSFYYGLRDGTPPQVNNIEIALNAIGYGLTVKRRPGGVVQAKFRALHVKVPPSRLRGVHWTSKKLFTLLWEKRFTAAELSRRSGVPADTLYGWKTDRSYPMLPALVDAFGALGYDLLVAKLPRTGAPKSDALPKSVRHAQRKLARWPNVFEMKRGYPIDLARAVDPLLRLFFTLAREQHRPKEWLVERTGYSHIVFDNLRRGDDCLLATLDTLFEALGYRLELQWPAEPPDIAAKLRVNSEFRLSVTDKTHRLVAEVAEYANANEWFNNDLHRASGLSANTIGLWFSGEQQPLTRHFSKLLEATGMTFTVRPL